MSGVIDLSIDENNIAWFNMNDEQNRNIFSEVFVKDFLHTLDEVEALKEAPRVMVLGGLSEVFCAGASKETLVALTEGKLLVKDITICERLVNAEFPIIAAMEGHAMGGGLALASCCDIIIAARESRYGAVFMSMGFTPGMGMTTLLEEMVGPYIACEMMMTAKRFKGTELEAMHTNINRFVPKARVMNTAKDIARQIAEKNPVSIRILKYTLAARRKKLLVEARKQEDLMHRVSFGLPETRKTIEEFYAE